MEPVCLLDQSGSMDWPAAPTGDDWPAPTSRRAIAIGALRGLVTYLESCDSEAAGEQAGGSDEKGGLLTFGFASGVQEIGDINSSNVERRLGEIRWGGGTHIMGAWEQALEDYDGEFGDRPERDRPVHLVLVITDGEAADWDQFVPVLESANAHRVFVVAILGYDEDPSTKAHTRTLEAYGAAAKRQQAKDKFGKSYVKVVSFDEVTNPREIAEDLITLVG